VLLILPGGLGGLWVRLRDVVVRLLVRPRPKSTAAVTAAVPADPAA
jgi:hypothetical protein